MSYRIRCIVQYDGSKYHGYQRQVNERTIQQVIESALTKMHKKIVTIHASGRTDTGVHAIGQVFHFNSKLQIKPENWKMAINCLLPKDIYIKDVEIVESQFHARYHVKSKEYRYYLSLAEYDPIRCDYVYFHNRPLDVNKMKEAIKLFIGTHDFTTFSSGSEEKNRVRTLFEAKVNQRDQELEFVFVGNGFLRYQVRIMMGTLIEIGEGKREIESINQLFLAKDRSKARYTAKPQGLYLFKVEY